MHKREADRLLLDELSHGNDSAFWTIWEAYGKHLFAVCLRHFRGAQPDAADAASRSMLAARNRLTDYAQQIENLEAWLTRLTCNVCLDIHRERRRESRMGFDVDDVSEQELNASSPSTLTPEQEVLQAEAYDRVAEAVRALPPRLRVAAEMRFLEDLDYGAIAARLGMTQENARKRVQQAREVLSERLGRALSLRAPSKITPSRSRRTSEGGLAEKR